MNKPISFSFFDFFSLCFPLWAYRRCRVRRPSARATAEARIRVLGLCILGRRAVETGAPGLTRSGANRLKRVYAVRA